MIASTPSENRTLWLMRLYFLAFIGAGGFLFPFISLFFRRNGLSGTEIGVIGAASAGAQLIAAPLWGRWSDAITQPRRLLQAALIGSGVAFLIMSQQKTFAGIALLTVLHGFISAGIGPLSDILALNVTRRTGYGSIRLWGSLGWAVLGLIGGLLIERSGMFVAFAGCAAMFFVAAVLINRIVVLPLSPDDGATPTVETPARVPVRSLLRERSLVGLAIALTILGLTGRGAVQFEAIYLDQLGASEFLVGLASAISAMTELPAMLLADRLLRRFSAGAVYCMGIVAHIIHAGAILLAPSVLTILLMRVAEGTSYGIFTVALVIYVSRRAPQQQVTVLLALYTVTLGGLVSLVANPLGGLVFDAVGAYWLYSIALAGDILALVVLALMNRTDPVL
jgi:MFS transporter, PPP family, 3-phenylpropionic acid transporter